MGLKISYAVGVAFLLVLVIVAIAFWWFVPNRAGPTTVVGALAPRIEQTKSGIAVTGMYAVRDADDALVLPVFVWSSNTCSATFSMARHATDSEDWSGYAGLHASIRTHGRLSLTLPDDRSSVMGEVHVMATATSTLPLIPSNAASKTPITVMPLEKVHPRRDDNIVTISLERGSTAAFPPTPFANDFSIAEVVLRVDDVDQAECEAITATAFWEDLGSATVYVHPSSDCDDIPSGGGEGDQLTKESDDDCDVGWEAEETATIYYGRVNDTIDDADDLTEDNITGTPWDLSRFDIAVIIGHHHILVNEIPASTDVVRFVLAVPTSMIADIQVPSGIGVQDKGLRVWITGGSNSVANTSINSSTPPLEIGGVSYTAYARTIGSDHEHTYTLIFGDD